jgi:hypothetical protein
MADFEEFSFVIPAYSPETMPLDRLIEYLQQISVVVGDAANLHLTKIERSSTAPIFHVPKRAALEAKERAAQFTRGAGTKDQKRAYNRLRRMVRRDAPEATRPAVLIEAKMVILEIPAAPEDVSVLSGVHQATTIDGLLISVGGAGDAAALRLQTLDGETIAGFSATRTLAKEMAKFIYEPLRVSGPGVWGRSEDGVWGLERMQIQSFELLDDRALALVFAELRELKVNWPNNVNDLLVREREEAI